MTGNLSVGPLTTRSDTATANIFEGPLEIVGNFAIQTLNNGDRLTGVGENPTLNAVILENGVVTTPTSLAGIQTANFDTSTLGVANAALAASTVNVQSAAALTSLSVSDVTQGFNVTGLVNALSSIAVTNTNQNIALTFSDAALAGATNSVTLTLNGVTGGNISSTVATAGGSGYETVNVVSQGFVTNAPGQIFAAAGNTAGYTTLNLSGSTPITLVAAATPATATTVNGANATGVITYTVPGAGNFSFTGGSASDVVTFAGSYTTADTINGGTGSNVLVLNAAEANSAANQTNVSNIADLRLADNGGTNTYTPANYGGATTLSLGANQANGALTTINYGAGASSLDLRAFEFDGAGDVALVAAGTGVSDSVTIGMASAAANDVFGAALNLNGIETATINNTGAAATVEGNLVMTPSIGGGRNLNITGSGQVIVEGTITASIINAASQTAGGFTMVNAAGTTTTVNTLAVNITGSPVADRLGGSANSDIINGGSGGADILNGNGGADLLTGGLGAGQDTFNFSVAGAGIAGNAGTLTPATSYSLVTDPVIGTSAATSDVVNVAFGVAFTGIAGLTDVNGTAIAAAGAVNAASVTGGQVIVLGNTVNLVKFVNPSTTATGATADAAFDSVIGAGQITSAAAAANAAVLGLFYDAANQQAVLGYIIDGNQAITAADQFNVLSTLSMSATDYANFGANQINFAAAANL